MTELVYLSVLSVCSVNATGRPGVSGASFFCLRTSASIRVVRYSRMSPYAASIKRCAAGLMDWRQAASAFWAASFCAAPSNFQAFFSAST